MRVDRVAVVLEGAVSPFELGVACEVFGTDRGPDGIPGWEFAVCSPNAEPVRSSSGFTLQDLAPLDVAGAADLVIVPICADRAAGPSDQVRTLLRDTVERGAMVAGFCTGVFALGHAGLLDDRDCTAHWVYEAQFRQLFPAARLDPSALYVADGPVVTSAGTVAAVDLCLHLVRRTRGAEAASALARRMVAAPHREGGQAQFVSAPLPRTEDHLLTELMEWVERRLDQPLTVAELAHRAGLGERTFLRRFTAATGTTPHRWLTQRRLERAMRLLERTALTLDEIAVTCGYGSAASLRHQFARRLGTSPSAYRRAFQIAS
ncbi:GlxA family transcriptional regulator [Streptoalloteichus tenebrarius]|uniref:GlxA family transcriptional regulator n=1 Tax=Streptoalloteichus tenebrarius (strain ATCC 17920 / DSM 40477 / JCM 4838 / CBS 697.72 / NBRC 16177 / NCIMB 11028 / NRRL B-12390 / A12253. 1 / ISP 5477) TaxID=1933 RepID=UPI0020A53CA1|nr:helix-turn-helix domain-containing protein [Streptoalloteichus tenebrarius]